MNNEQKPETELITFTCGPTNYPTCICNCPDSCEHDWTGPTVSIGDTYGGESVTCLKCEMTAFEHSMWVGP